MNVVISLLRVHMLLALMASEGNWIHSLIIDSHRSRCCPRAVVLKVICGLLTYVVNLIHILMGAGCQTSSDYRVYLWFFNISPVCIYFDWWEVGSGINEIMVEWLYIYYKGFKWKAKLQLDFHLTSFKNKNSVHHIADQSESIIIHIYFNDEVEHLTVCWKIKVFRFFSPSGLLPFYLSGFWFWKSLSGFENPKGIKLWICNSCWN